MEPKPSLTASSRLSQPSQPPLGPCRTDPISRQQLVELKAICKETADLLGNKDQGGPQVQAQPGPSTGPVTPPRIQEEKRTLQEQLGLDSRPLSAHQEERALTQKKRKNPASPQERALQHA
ncbi:hypothetical protein RHS01_08655 [Rhizoctonia solani]|uniref:Uncharacterized protein n=1 Tax=Rhizoctonia solani TaxID=456999 RepID=A0A8H7I6R4_9AGAM|nr:hypothetical protein RHS01_08655 [Rhizoctonia solani]